MHLAVMLGVIAGTAALTGALLVGDSMRGSLREQAMGRLGRVDYALIAERFFRESLAAEFVHPKASERPASAACPLILQRGGVAHADSGRRANRAAILGVDKRFWELSAEQREAPKPADGERTVVLNRALADELGAAPGADVLVRVGKPSAVPTETRLGRRDDVSVTLRLTVSALIPAEGLGAIDQHRDNGDAAF